MLISSVNYKLRRKAAWISLIASIVVLLLKAFAYYLTNSTAVLSDALESIVNILTASIALFVIKYVAQPADKEHPYGHGKAEYFSAAFEGGLIFFAALVILIESVKSLFTQNQVNRIEQGFLVILLATLFNLILGIYLRQVAKKENSETLRASSAHILSDVKTTGGVMVALGLVSWTGQTWWDPLIAIGVAIHLGWEGFQIVRRSVGGLIDEMDQASLSLLASHIKKHVPPEIMEIHHLRVIRSGSFHHIDASVVVPGYWDIDKAHQLAHELEEKVVREYPYDAEIAFHLEPCLQDFCKECRVEKCPVRVADFIKPYSFEVKDLISDKRKVN